MLSMWRIGLVLSIVFFVGSAYSEPPPPTQTKPIHKPETNPAQHEEAPTKNQQGTEPSPFFIKIVPSPVVDPESSKKHEESRDYSSAEWWLVYVTGVLCAITLVLACFTGYLWNATKKLVSGAEDTAKRQLRAYVMGLRAEITNNHHEPGTNGTPWIYLTFKNFGKIPATNIRCKIAICVKDVPLSTAHDGEREPRSNEALAPGDTWTLQLEGPIIHHTLTARQSALYIHGEIHYCDGFAPDRISRFRYMRRGSPNWSRDGEMDTCQEGNSIA